MPIRDRKTVRYHLRVDGKIVYAGATDNPEERELLHRTEHPTAELVPFGRKVTKRSGEAWASIECVTGFRGSAADSSKE